MEIQQYLASAMLAIVVIGCLGNLLSLVLFLRHSTSVNTLLSALSLVDLCLLLLAVPVFVLPGLDIWSDFNSLTNFFAYVVKFVYPINLMCQTCSIYIMVLITIERWTAVCKPLQVRIWCTVRTSRLALLCILIFAMAYNMVRFWEYSIVTTPNGTIYERNLRDIHRHPFYVIGYYTASYLLTHFLVPFGAIIVMNGHVCKSIIRLRRARQMLTRQQQREQSTTLMLLVVTLVFAICNTLPFLLNLAECVKRDLFDSDATAWIAYQLNDLSNLLVVLNSSTTWIVYIIFSAKYRQTASRILCCMEYEKDVKYNSLSRTHSMRASTSLNRRAPATTLTTDSVRYSPVRNPPKRTDRSVSEYNERIRRPAAALRLPRRPPSIKSIKSTIYRVASHRSTPRHEDNTNSVANDFLSPPPTHFPIVQWPDRPQL